MGFRIAIAAATIGVIYGYDLGAIAGALLFITDEFELSTKQTEWVATIVVAGSVLGALCGGRLANAIGRKPAMVIVALTYAVFAILSGLATSLVFLDVARFFLGVTIGISIVTAPIFVAESAPAAVRGGLVVMYQVATVTGIVVAYFVDYALAGAEAWRWMLALSAIPALGVVAVLARLPDTPRWYVMKGRMEEARATLALTDPEADADRELAEIEEDLRSERGGSARGDAARALPAGDGVRGRARLPDPDHGHQRGRLLQPDDLRGDGLQRQHVAAAPAGARAGRLARRHAGVAVGRRPARAAADAADRHRRHGRRGAAADRRVRRRRAHQDAPAGSASRACSCSPPASTSASARSCGSTRRRASRRGCARSAPRRC